jgi:microfibrillar-associated protein 1
VPDFVQEEHQAPQVTSSAGPKEDRRLKRLASVAHSSEDDLVAKRRRHADSDEDEPVRRPVRAEIVESAHEEVVRAPVSAAVQDEESDEDVESRRARIRERMAAEEQEELLPVMEDDEEDDDEDDEESGEDEDDESDEQFFVPHRAAAIRPHFVKREERETIAEAERAAEAEEQARAELDVQRQQVKKESTVSLLKQTIEQEIAEETQKAAGATEDDDADLMSEEDEQDETVLQHEYELWRIRELKRIKRDKEQREQHELEKREIERRRAMSDAEVEAENKLDPTKNKEKKKIKFLQKYYHKGAYYSDELKELLPTHDFTAPTGEDAMFSRDMMPKVMQVKNYGKASRSKWTHLVNEDTSLLDKEGRRDKELNQRLKQRLTGTAPVFNRPAKKKSYDE